MRIRRWLPILPLLAFTVQLAVSGCCHRPMLSGRFRETQSPYGSQGAGCSDPTLVGMNGLFAPTSEAPPLPRFHPVPTRPVFWP